MERHQMIVAGIGFRQSADLASLREAFLAAGGTRATAIATAEDKAQAPVLQAFAAERGLHILAITAQDLAAQTTPTQSPRILARYGTGCLAEASALAAAGPNARLLSPRTQSQDGKATAALAERSLA
jgi:cobalt-precorrin 5A hydrolase